MNILARGAGYLTAGLLVACHSLSQPAPVRIQGEAADIRQVTFDRVIPVAACTDMARPQATSSVVMPVVLRFGALATSNGSLGGWLRPYRDPDLGCWMDTWFEGRLVRDTLEGSFFSRRTDTDTVRAGTWWAARTR